MRPYISMFSLYLNLCSYLVGQFSFLMFLPFFCLPFVNFLLYTWPCDSSCLWWPYATNVLQMTCHSVATIAEFCPRIILLLGFGCAYGF